MSTAILRKRADLATYTIDPSIWLGSQNAFDYRLSTLGDDAIGAILDCSPEEVRWLRSGAAFRVQTEGLPVVVPDIALPTKAVRLRDDFGRLLTALSAGARVAALGAAEQPMTLTVGEVKSNHVAWIASSIDGVNPINAQFLVSPAWRVKNRESVALSVASIAQVCGANPQVVAQWELAEVADLPWSDTGKPFTRWCQVQRWLAAGPTAPGARARSGRVTAEMF